MAALFQRFDSFVLSLLCQNLEHAIGPYQQGIQVWIVLGFEGLGPQGFTPVYFGVNLQTTRGFA